MPSCRTWTIGFLLFTGGCTSDTAPVLEVSSAEYITQNGSTSVPVSVTSNTTQFHIDLHADAFVAVDRILAPSGEAVLDYRDYPSPRVLTQGIIPFGSNASLNWPIRAEDGELTTGDWIVEVAAVDDEMSYVSGLTLSVSKQTKTDSNLRRGTVRARVLFDEDTSADDATRDATEQAVSIWEGIFDDWGLEIEVDFAGTALESDLAIPDDDSAIYEDLDGDGSIEEITIVVGQTIDGGLDKFGLTGAVPGALTHSPKGVVLLSWLALAGQDGAFDQAEKDLFGETIAHEVGHYLGLFHPVEDTWANWDYLGDTPECSNTETCESLFGDNLMFPYPLCDGVSCEPQRRLSEDQRGVIHRYTGTL